MDTNMLDDMERWSIRFLGPDLRVPLRFGVDLFEAWRSPMDEAEEWYERTVLHEGGPTERSD